MGASSSCQIFEQLSSVLQWVMQSKYKSTVQKNILYVFLFFGILQFSFHIVNTLESQ